MCISGITRKPNDCVMCGAILYELDTQQCHTRPKVECGTAGLPMSEV